MEDVDIHNIDYEQQIREAISNKDFRLAVRLWFLRTLKSFSDKELVQWKIDKTNSDYYYELSGSKYQKDFGDVSKSYDYIWYGEFPVDEISYRFNAPGRSDIIVFKFPLNQFKLLKKYVSKNLFYMLLFF